MGLSTNSALCPACARKCGGFPRSGRGGQLLVWRLPSLWAVLPGTPSPFLPGFLPKPFLETQPTQPPHTGPVFPWWRTRPALAEPCLSLSIRSLENNLVGRRTIPWPRTGKSFVITVTLRCLLKVFIFLLSYGLHKREPRLFRLSRYLEPVPASAGIWTSWNESGPDTQTANTREVGKIEPDQRGTQLLQFALSGSVI